MSDVFLTTPTIPSLLKMANLPPYVSNILYWLDEPVKVLREIRRVLSDDGRAILCVPDPTFYTLCESYRWRELDSDWLRLLNGG